MPDALAGHVALVTGAARGIGAEFAARLAREGAAVAVVDLADGSQTVESIEASGGRAAAYQADIADGEAVAAVADRVRSHLGTVDILVNNAGIYPVTPFSELTAAEWRRVFAINVDAMFHTCRAFLPGMKDRGWGRVVNVASNAVALQVPGQVHYIASKMAVIGLTRGIATEFGEFGITANAIAPSAVRTPGTAHLPEEGFAALANAQSIKRSSVPADLAGTLAFLASDDAAFITGQTVYVDGGMVRAL
jgi:3-oxoacyl-[acyl-carrier protein] reductase/(S)-1-phenylethanol dehydrogenase